MTDKGPLRISERAAELWWWSQGDSNPNPPPAKTQDQGSCSSLTHRVEQDREAAARGEAWHDSGLVFTSAHGTPVDPRNFFGRFKERAAAAGVPVIPVHSTRRTCASLLVELDVHPRVTMQILRHSQIAVSMDIYAQVAPAKTRAALARLGETFVPAEDGVTVRYPRDGM